MPYKIAIASSDGINIDLHFGKTDIFVIVAVEDDGSYNIEGNRIVQQCSETSENISCGSGSGCKSGGCGNMNTDADIDAKVSAISDCRCLLCKRIGPGGQKQLERRKITTFQIDLTVETALTKVIDYYTKTDNHISLNI